MKSNNQDASCCQMTERGLIAVVCDGCGSGSHSEVGTKLAARLLVEILQRALVSDLPLEPETLGQTLQQALLAQLRPVVDALGGDRTQTVRDYLLFTIAGVVMTPIMTSIFTLGDGVVAINAQVIQLGPFANNAPPYLAYNFLEEASDALQIKVLQTLPTDQVQSLLLGTDGVGDLIAVAEQPLPGRAELVGDIAQFWQDDRYFRNPDQIRRRLTLINREVSTFHSPSQQWLRQPGLLPDDTTLVVIRRQKIMH